jgi:hypothetical protein
MEPPTAEHLFGPGLDVLFRHLAGLPAPSEIVGRRHPVLTGYGSLEGEDPVPFLTIPGGRRGYGFNCPLGRGDIDGFRWALDGVADYEAESDQDIGMRGSHTPEELGELRTRWPFAFPATLLPKNYVSSNDDLSPGQYWRIAGYQPISVYWILSVYKNPSNPSEQPSVRVKLTYATYHDRLLQAYGYVSLSSERRSGSPAIEDEKLWCYAQLLKPRERARFLLHHFMELRELPRQSQVVRRLSRKDLASLMKQPAGEPHGDLPVIVLDPSGRPRRERILAQISLLILQNQNMPAPVHAAADSSLRAHLAKRLAKACRGARELEERIQDAIPALLKNYSGRDSSAHSFDGYLAQILRQRIRREVSEKTHPKKEGEALSAHELSQRARVSRSYAYKLAAKGRVGQASVRKKQDISPGGLRVDAKARSYAFSGEDVEKTAQLAESRKMKAALVKLLAEQRATTPRAAQMLLNRRLSSGGTLEEIATELLGPGRK